MRNKLLLLATLALFTVNASAATIVYFGTLSGDNEVPPVASPGNGFAQVTYDDIAHTLHVESVFADLLAGTTAAHIHCCTTPTASVATTTPSFVGFPLGVTFGSMDETYDLTLESSWRPGFITANGGTTAGAEAALAQGLADGVAYFNIHTSAFPGGEIRANLALVPEPGISVLLGIALAGLGLARRRR